jgi:hypothetical protein
MIEQGILISNGLIIMMTINRLKKQTEITKRYLAKIYDGF